MKSATHPGHQSQDRKAPEREGQKESHFHDMRTDSNGVEGDGSAAMTNAGFVHEPWWLGGLFVSTGVSVCTTLSSSLDSGSCVKRVTESPDSFKNNQGLIKRPTKPTLWWPRMAPSPCLTNLTTGIVCVVMDEFKPSGLVCVRVEVHCRNS